MAIYIFLQINGYELEAIEPGAVDLIERLAAGDIAEDALAGWMRDHAVPLG